MALSKEKFHLRTEHSKLLGYWTVELGGLNQVRMEEGRYTCWGLDATLSINCHLH